jgi:hypothetical protein
MRPVVQDFVQRALFAEQIDGAKVLEVGSYDVNGSVRPHIESLNPELYVGVDMRDGPGVDVVCDCENLDQLKLNSIHWDDPIKWDLVVSTEMLEHALDWRRCMSQMAAVVAPGGLLLVTTVRAPFPYHPFPNDYWRFEVGDLKRIVEALGLETVMAEDFTEFGVGVLARKSSDPLPQGSLEGIEVAGVFDG